MKWPEGIASRVHLNEFAKQWHQREHELRAHLDDAAQAYADALRQRDPDTTSLAMGQSAAFVDGIRPAADVAHSICADAERILSERSLQLRGGDCKREA
jgi:nitronate monooxygenase